jgi:hypothetical protein
VSFYLTVTTIYAVADILAIFEAMASLDGSTTTTFEESILLRYHSMREKYPFLDELIDAKKVKKHKS